MAKRVLVLCGNGVATSTVAAKKVQEYLDKEKVAANVIQAKIGELASYADKVDVIILMAMGAVLPAGCDKPVIKGLPFITGVGQQQALEQVKGFLTK